MKRLLNYSITSLDDIERKGNIRYVDHYLAYFDEYVGVYVWGSARRERSFGKSTVVCVGTGRGLRDLLFSPWRVFREARRRKVTHFLTADLAYGWWHSLLLVLFLRSKIVVMPVCTPPEILKNSGRTYSGFSPRVESFLISLTFLVAARIIVAKNSFATRDWLDGLWCRRKVRVVDATPEELPSVEFLERLARLRGSDKRRARRSDAPWKLIYVGRLEPEKLAGDLIEVASILRRANKDFVLTLVGDGSLRHELEGRVASERLSANIRFLGFLPAERVAEEIYESDIFLSTLTGTAIKEAAFARLALVAYAIDYVPALFTHEVNCLLATGGDACSMADQVLRLMDDEALHSRLAENLNGFASERWTEAAVRNGLAQAFEDLR